MVNLFIRWTESLNSQPEITMSIVGYIMRGVIWELHDVLACHNSNEVEDCWLSSWLTTDIARAVIGMGEGSHSEDHIWVVLERRCLRLRQEEGTMCVEPSVKGEDIDKIGCQVGVTESRCKTADIAHPVFVHGWVESGRGVDELLYEPNLAARS